MNGYGDLINSNGITDILCWQNVSRETRLALYRDYTSWLYQTKTVIYWDIPLLCFT